MTEVEGMKLKLKKHKDQIDLMTTTIIDVQKELKHQKRMRIIAECRTLANTIIIHGIPIHEQAIKKGRIEEQSETNDQLKITLDKMKILLLEIGSFSAYRLPIVTRKEKQGKDFTTTGIRLTLLNPRARELIYKGLLQFGSEMKNIKVQQAIPRELIPLKKSL